MMGKITVLAAIILPLAVFAAVSKMPFSDAQRLGIARVNVFAATTFSDNEAVKGIVVTSAKRDFAAGMDLNVIAALLTLIGYSLNDTIVIYDRVRENLRKYRKMDITSLLNLSMNETLSRTVATNFAMLLALGELWVAGVGPDWRTGFYRHERRRIVALPTYPFERRRFWMDSREAMRAGEGLLVGIQGTGADIAVHNAKRAVPVW